MITNPFPGIYKTFFLTFIHKMKLFTSNPHKIKTQTGELVAITKTAHNLEHHEKKNTSTNTTVKPEFTI